MKIGFGFADCFVLHYICGSVSFVLSKRITDPADNRPNPGGFTFEVNLLLSPHLCRQLATNASARPRRSSTTPIEMINRPGVHLSGGRATGKEEVDKGAVHGNVFAFA